MLSIRSRKAFRIRNFLPALFLLASFNAIAATWTGAAIPPADTSWINAANWSGATLPANSTAGIASFPAATTRVVNQDSAGAWTLNQMTVSAAYSFLGAPIAFAGANPFLTVSAPTVIVNALSFTAPTWSVTATANTVLAGGGTGSGQLAKKGSGALTLGGTWTLTGSTVAEAGTLLVTGTLVTTQVDALAGAIVGGTGTIDAPLLQLPAGAALVPGPLAGPGLLLTRNVALNQADFHVRIEGTTPGSQYSRLAVAGTVNLANANLVLSGAHLPAALETFTIVVNDGTDAVTGTFSGLADGAIINFNGRKLRVAYSLGDGNDVLLSTVAHVVVPSAGANGTIATPAPRQVAEGSTTTFTVTPNAGYAASVGGTCGGSLAGTVYTTNPVTANCTVEATFVPVDPPRLGNLSTRMQVLTGNDVMIGGFVVAGAASKTVVVRARGPSLTQFGVPNAMANPQLQLVRSSDQLEIAFNDNWQSASNAAAVTASGFAPSNDLEAAILVSLAPGAYTAIVSGVSGGIGVGIVEIFEVDAPTMPLTNISTRGQVLGGNDVMIGGFVIQGSVPKQVVVRARGPSLIPFGVANAIANPQLQLVRSSDQSTIRINDNWESATNAAAITASGFAPSNNLEAAILVTLPPGAYTAIVTGVDGATGVGIVEVFAANP